MILTKTAWFMTHRTREAMRFGDLAPMGGGGRVEADETYFDKQENRLDPDQLQITVTSPSGSREKSIRANVLQALGEVGEGAKIVVEGVQRGRQPAKARKSSRPASASADRVWGGTRYTVERVSARG